MVLSLAILGLTSLLAAGQGDIVVIQSPEPGAEFEPGDRVAVIGRVVKADGAPIGGESVVVRLIDAQGRPVPGIDRSVVSSPGSGTFIAVIELPVGLRGGPFQLLADAASTGITDAQVSIVIRDPPPSGLMIVLLIVVVTVIAVVCVLMYLRIIGRVGNGKSLRNT